jgi:hypothetical protein
MALYFGLLYSGQLRADCIRGQVYRGQVLVQIESNHRWVSFVQTHSVSKQKLDTIESYIACG